ncbi:MAG: PxKF domain-containing protein [Candidatus Paceibacterota bacterium]|jgi:hypothetical protein
MNFSNKGGQVISAFIAMAIFLFFSGNAKAAESNCGLVWNGDGYYFEGTLDEPFGSLPAGAPFSGWASYYPGQPNLNKPFDANGNPSNIPPYRGDYKYNYISLTLGGATVTDYGTGVINVYDHGTYDYSAPDRPNTFPTDLFHLYTYDVHGSFGGLTLAPGAGIQLVLQDVTGTAWSGPVLPSGLTLDNLTTGNATFIEIRSAYIDNQSVSARGFLSCRNHLPAPPTLLIQSDVNSRQIEMGGNLGIGENEIIFAATLQDPDNNRTSLQIEARDITELGGAFDDATANILTSDLINSGDTATIVFDAADGSYHWRARTIDEFGSTSAWVEFGNNLTTDIDFGFEHLPAVPANLKQYTKYHQEIPIGEEIGKTKSENTVVFEGELEDRDHDFVILEVEMRGIAELGGGFDEAVAGTRTSSSTISGYTGSVSFEVTNGNYHWRARAIDEHYNKSAWVEFGNNPTLDTDFGIAQSPATPTYLKQYDGNNQEMAVGGEIGKTIEENAIIFEGKMEDSEKDTLQVEMRRVAELGGSFDETTAELNETSEKIVSGDGTRTRVTFKIVNGSDGNYHWRARAVDENGETSEWVEFGENAISETDFDYGFEPHPYGYRFENRKVEPNSLTAGGKWDIFGKTFNLSGVSQQTQFEIYKKFGLNVSVPDIFNGSCYGMALSSQIQYGKNGFAGGYYGNFGQSLAAKGNLIWNLDGPAKGTGGGWLGSNIASKPVLETILSLQLSQKGDVYQNAVNQAKSANLFSWDLDEAGNRTSSARSIFDKLSKEYSDKTGPLINDTYIIVMGNVELGRYLFAKPSNQGHALVPYKVEGNKIYVYDVNHPNTNAGEENNGGDSYDSYIEIDRNNNTWQYDGLSWPIEDNIFNTYKNYIGLLSVNALYNGGALPKPFVLSKNTATVSLDGNANLLLADDQGRFTGIKDALIVEEIPDISPIYDLNVGSDEEVRPWNQTYHAESDVAFKSEVTGTENGTYSFTKFGPGYFATFFDVSINQGSVDQISVSADAVSISASSDQETKKYNLVFNKDIDGNDVTFTATDIPISAHMTERFSVDWNILSQGGKGVTMQIDREGDGTFEQTVNIGATFSDAIAPTTLMSVSGAKGNNDWFVSNVNVELSSSDNDDGIGVENAIYSLDNGQIWNKYENAITISEEGIHNVLYRSQDLFGNIEETRTKEIKIDKTAPRITISSPLSGRVYVLGQSVMADWLAEDDLSGVASSFGSVPDGSAINTSSVGAKTFAETSEDNAGNVLTRTINYYVHYSFSGVLDPMRQDGSSVSKLGSAVPIKFQIKDFYGNFISNATAYLYATKISNTVTGTDEAVSVGEANTGNVFRYDAITNQYIYNLGTKNFSVGTWQLSIKLDDGTVNNINVSLK